MHLHNLFTSSSKKSSSKNSFKVLSPNQPKLNQSGRIRNVLATSFCFLSSLVAFDVAINFLFPYPSDPLNVSPGALNLYFDYGRSLEGKINRQIGPTTDTSALIARAGWLGSALDQAGAAQPEPGDDLLVSIYGMSFAEQIGNSMATLDPKLSLRTIGGPTAPPNFAFAAYQLDRGHHQANVVILGVLASSMKGMDAMTGMTWGTDYPAPFTFPKYRLNDGKLEATQPHVQSLDQLRETFQDPQKRQAYVSQLQQNDRFFDTFTFEKNWLDHSAILRMIRRAWAKDHQERVTAQIHDQNGFNPNWEQIPVLRKIVEEFATTAKQDGKLPIVLVINDRGYNDDLYQVLKPTLETANIPYISTHEIAPATDARNFIGDGHFTEQVNKKIAEKVLALINAQLHRVKT